MYVYPHHLGISYYGLALLFSWYFQNNPHQGFWFFYLPWVHIIHLRWKSLRFEHPHFSSIIIHLQLTMHSVHIERGRRFFKVCNIKYHQLASTLFGPLCWRGDTCISQWRRSNFKIKWKWPVLHFYTLI